jgi:hypothetical protein
MTRVYAREAMALSSGARSNAEDAEDAEARRGGGVAPAGPAQRALLT